MNSKMESRQHWIFDYIKKDAKQGALLPSQGEISSKKGVPRVPSRPFLRSEDYKQKRPIAIRSAENLTLLDTRYRHTEKSRNAETEESFHKKRSIGKDQTPIYDPNENNEEGIFKRKIDAEIKKIHTKLKMIKDISSDIFALQDQTTYDELRETVFEYINDNVTNKIQEIKDLFAVKKYEINIIQP